MSIVGVESVPCAPRHSLNKLPAPASRHASGKRNPTKLRGWGIADLP